jgi:polyphosphate kinase
MDLYARSRWVEYAKAKDAMFAATDTDDSPWNVVPSDDKKAAQLNCITHLLSLFEVGEVPYDPIELPPRQEAGTYVRPPVDTNKIVPQVFKPKKEKNKE